jgi:hypothetical protein
LSVQKPQPRRGATERTNQRTIFYFLYFDKTGILYHLRFFARLDHSNISIHFNGLDGIIVTFSME